MPYKNKDDLNLCQLPWLLS